MADSHKNKLDRPDLFTKYLAQPEPSTELKDKILEDAKRVLTPAPGNILWPFGSLWKPASLLAGALAFGILVGFTMISEDSGDINSEIEDILIGDL